jgi:hypothetical protein
VEETRGDKTRAEILVIRYASELKIELRNRIAGGLK